MSSRFSNPNKPAFGGVGVPSSHQASHPSLSYQKPEEQSELKPNKRIQRSRQQGSQKPVGGSFVERKTLNTQPTVAEVYSQKALASILKGIIHGKLLEVLGKLRECSRLASRNKLRRLEELCRLLTNKTNRNMRSAWLNLSGALNINNKQLQKISNKNAVAEKMALASIGRSSINKQLQLGFLKIKKVYRKGRMIDKTKQTKALVRILGKVITTVYKQMFERLVSRCKRGRYIWKSKLSFSILNRMYRQRLAIAFSYTKFSTKTVGPPISEPQKLKFGSPASRTSSRGQSPTNLKRQSSQSILEKFIIEQISIKGTLDQRLQWLDQMMSGQQEIRRAIREQSKRQLALKKQLIQKKAAEQRERQLNIQTEESSDKLRIHHNDPIFFQRLRQIYLTLKELKAETVSKQAFIKDHNLDFKELFDHPQYLLSLNRKLKEEMRRIEESIAPSDGAPKPSSKLVKDIQQMKEELAKENQILKKSISKYVAVAYDMQVASAETKTPESELYPKITITYE